MNTKHAVNARRLPGAEKKKCIRVGSWRGSLVATAQQEIKRIAFLKGSPWLLCYKT